MQFTFARGVVLGAAVVASIAGLALAAAPAGSDQVAKPGIYFDAKAVKDAFAKPGGDNFFSVPGGPQFLLVRAGHRKGTGTSEWHEERTDVLYVVSGTATFVTGGKLTEPKDNGPGELLGKAIEGGTEQELKPGDVIIIPPKTPHWFKSIPGDIEYLTVVAK